MSSSRLFALALLALSALSGVRADESIEYACYDVPDPITMIKVPVKCSGKGYEDGLLYLPPTPYAAVEADADAAPVKAFEINLECTGGRRRDFCAQVSKALNLTTQILSSVLDIKTTIVVFAEFQKLRPEILGSAGPARFEIVREESGGLVSYPQALAKQYVASAPQYIPVDINVRINSDQDYFFWGDRLNSLGAGKPDFVSLVLHEILHGLGLIGGWKVGNNEITRETIAIMDAITDGSGRKQVGFFETPFDRSLVVSASNTPLANLVKEASIALFGPGRNMTMNLPPQIEDRPRLLQRDRIFAPLLRLFEFNRNALASKTKSGTVFTETATAYRAGSSIYHLDFDTYVNSKDFLMVRSNTNHNLAQDIARTYFGSRGAELLDYKVLKQVDLSLALGPGVTAIMDTMGWPMRKTRIPVFYTGAASSIETRSIFGLFALSAGVAVSQLVF